MSAHTTTTLDNGHALTVVCMPVLASGPRRERWEVLERDTIGVVVQRRRYANQEGAQAWVDACAANGAAPPQELYLEWLGSGHYRNDLYEVYSHTEPLDVRGRPRQLFRGTFEECHEWVMGHGTTGGATSPVDS